MPPTALLAPSRDRSPKPAETSERAAERSGDPRPLATLLLVFALLPSPLSAQAATPHPEELVSGQACHLAPALIEARRACKLGEHPEDECAWLPILEEMSKGENERAAQRLAESFALPAENARRLREAIRLWLPTLLGDPCSAEVLGDLLVSSLSLETIGTWQQPEGILLLFELLGVDRQASAILSKTMDPAVWDSLRRAVESFVRLARRTELMGGVLEMLGTMSPWLDGGLLPTLDTWPTELEDMAATLERIDAALLELSEENLDSIHRELEELIRRRPSLEEQGQLWARAGFGLTLHGLVEDSAIALLKAERCFLEAPSLRPVSRFVRIYTAQTRRLLFGALGWQRDVESMQRSLEAMAESPLERWLVRQIPAAPVNLTSVGPSLVLGGGGLQEILQLVFSGGFELQEMEAFRQSALIILPGMASSGLEPIPRSRSKPSATFAALAETMISGDLEESLEGWLGMAKDSRQYELALWPAMIAVSALKQGRLELARTAFEEAITRLEAGLASVRVDDVARGWVDQISAPFYSPAVALSFLADKPEEAFDYAERGRAFNLRRLLGAPGAPGHGTLSPEERMSERALVALTTSGISSTADEQRELWARFESARRERRLLDTRPGGDLITRPASLAEVRRHLRPEETLLAYYPGSGSLWIWVVRPEGLWTHSIPWKSEEIETVSCLARASRWSGEDRKWRGTRWAHDAKRRGVEVLGRCSEKAPGIGPNQQLYQHLVAPVSEYLETGGGRLIIVPHGPLHGVPWAALRRPDGQPLVADFETVVVPSAHVFVTLRERGELSRRRSPGPGRTDTQSPQPLQSPQPSTRALVLGDPATHLPSLPAAREEALAVAELLAVEPLVSTEASEAAVLQGAADAVVLHLAVHGIYEREAPLFSRLQLAAGNGHDGFLHVHEIWDRLVLKEARLVVLSACETASGEPTRGDDIVGLTQAFLVAGSPTVVATLWPVDDPASARLMTSFYRYFQSGMEAGQALRAAQLELARRSEYAAPYFWAGFVLVGDPETHWPGKYSSGFASSPAPSP